MIKNKIVVLGNQKSGTSAITALLGLATGLSYQVDIPCLWPPTLYRILDGKISFTDIASTDAFPKNASILKEPNLTFLYHIIKEHFENCRFLFILRNPLDNIRSILNRLKLIGSYKNKNYTHFRLSETEEAVLNPMLLNQEYIHYIDVLSDRWNIAFKVYYRNRDYFTLIRYEDFILNKTEYIYNLINTLELSIENDISKYVDIQFQPKGKPVRNFERFFGKVNYNRIITICSDNARKLGYDL